MSPDERLRYHQENSGPLMDGLETWLRDQIDGHNVEPNSGLGEAIEYMRKHWPKLTLFLRAPGAVLDDNICERALKKAILHRKNALFYRTAMDALGKSDRPMVPTNPPNKAGRPAAEAVAGRGLAKGNTGEQNAPRTKCRTSAPNALDRVREAAAKHKGMRFTALLHHVDVDRLRTAFRALKKDAAPGVDGVTWEQYAEHLENTRDLHRRLHQGVYRARPSRRAYIPKADGRQRPLGIASLEDKVVQRAVVEVLNAPMKRTSSVSRMGSGPGAASITRWTRLRSPYTGR